MMCEPGQATVTKLTFGPMLAADFRWVCQQGSLNPQNYKNQSKMCILWVNVCLFCHLFVTESIQHASHR